MKIAIRYYTKSGNTKKLADAIAQVVGVPALSIDTPLEDEVDILFLGNSVYAFGIDEKVAAFIDGLDKGKVKKVVNFSTASIVTSTYKQVSKHLAAKGIPLDEREFHCKGNMKFLNAGRPNDADVADVKSFAAGIIKK